MTWRGRYQAARKSLSLQSPIRRRISLVRSAFRRSGKRRSEWTLPPKLPEARRKDLAKSYGDRAVESLRQAIAKGYKDAGQIKKDKDLDPLRQRDDFRKVVAELAPKGA